MARDVFINEIHYDNASTDTGEFVEVAGPAGTDLTGWSVVLYNGSATVRAPYATLALSGTLADQTAGYGFLALDGPGSGIQNGAPDGLALVDDSGAVVQFLSYEGSFAAVSGPAAGLASFDIDAEETSDTPAGFSLQYTGSDAEDGIWQAPQAETRGAPNTGQSLAAPAPVINEFVANHTGSDTNEYVEVLATPGADLSGYTLLQIEGDASSAPGVIDSATPLGTADGAGYWTTGFLNNAFENGTMSLLLVEGFTGAAGDDLDTDDDGMLDTTPWSAVADAVAASDGGAGDRAYGGTVLAAGFDGGSFTVGGASRIPDGADTDSVGDWVRNDFDLAGLDGFTGTPQEGEALNTPGVTNAVVDGNGGDPMPVLISAVQGTGEASPLAGETVTVEAVVVGDFQSGDADDTRNLRGFYLQEEDADADVDRATSEGVFVFDPDILQDVALGDRVRVTGTVSEFFGETQITANAISVLGTQAALPTAATIDLPAAQVTLSQDGDFQPDLEAYEGMRVSFADTLVITEQFQLDRFNEIKLVAGDRPQQYTQINAPDAAGYQDYLREIGARTITYDDGLSVQNAAIGLLDGFGPDYSTETAPRMGDTTDDLSGVLSYQWAGNSASGATWRLRATEADDVSFETANPRPETPDGVGGTLQVASFNVLNFFTTLDTSGTMTDIGADPRGADNQAEYERQRDKLVTAIVDLDADILGLIEIENDFAGDSFAIDTLTTEINARFAEPIYAFVDPGREFVGTDAIANGFLYRTDTVELVGDAVIFDAPAFVDPNDTGQDRNRPAVIQTFRDAATDGEVTIAVHHFKSKGDSGLADAPLSNPDADQGGGAGFWDDTRTDAAQALAEFLATDPTGTGDEDVLILGDLNSYAEESPIATLDARGYTDLAAFFEGDDTYSYVFDGQTGTLDYALANRALLDQVTGATTWHINADEADALDYNLDFGRDPAIFDGDVPWRASDHDPVLVGLALEPERQLVVGTDGNDRLTGSVGADLVLSLGGRNDIVFGGDGADVFRFGSETGNGVRERDQIRDYQPGLDVIDLGGATIAAIKETPSQVRLELAGDGDTIFISGIGSFDQISFAGQDLV